MLELLIKLGLSVVVVVVAAGTLSWIWTHQVDPRATLDSLFRGAVEPDWVVTRNQDKLYQDGVPVADVVGEVVETDSKITFRRLANASSLDRSKEFEYRRLKARVLNVRGENGISVRQSPDGNMETMREVLKDVECEIVK